MPDYLELLRRRAKADTATLGTIHLLVDVEGHAEAVQRTIEARRAVAAAKAAIDMADLADARGDKTPQRLNSTPPRQRLEQALDEARNKHAEAVRAEQETFITLHVAHPTTEDLTAVSDDTDRTKFYPELLRRCMRHATDHDGNRLDELTPDVVADALPSLPHSVFAGVMRWFDDAAKPVDYPTLPAS